MVLKEVIKYSFCSKKDSFFKIDQILTIIDQLKLPLVDFGEGISFSVDISSNILLLQFQNKMAVKK